MNKKIAFLFLLGFIILSGCITTEKAGENGLSNELKKMIYASCFEVVILKPEEKNVTYEKELPWNLIPFNIRNDKYYSIGTAFAISDTELVTAFHVSSLTDESMIFKNFFIRDQEQNVFEFDQIKSFHNYKDFVVFTVKGKKFDQWLKLNDKFNLNEAVYTAGNAYGEGIIIRKGDLIGTIPEEEEGKWKLLKSSSDVNSGNSGGPLLNSSGDVIGVVVSRKDNICYSLPVMEILNSEKNKGFFHVRTIYKFDLFPEDTGAKDFDYAIELPLQYQKIGTIFQTEYQKIYNKHMNKLFEDNQKNIFPNGDSSLESLYDSSISYYPQVIFKKKDNMKWYYSDIKYEKSSINDNGVINYANIMDSLLFIDLKKPDTVTLNDIYSNPKTALDLIFKGISVPRKIAGQEIRITSLGTPINSSNYIDNYNRKWMINIWLIDYSDEVIVLFTSPTPQGEICILKATTSSNLEYWLYDLKKIVNFIYIPYFGKLKEWKTYLKLNTYLPDYIKKISLNYQENDKLSLKTGNFSSDIPSDIIKINDNTELEINYSFIKNEDKVVWDISRMQLAEFKTENYLVLSKKTKPDQKLPENYLKYWDSIVKQSHPFTHNPFSENGRTNIAAVLPQFLNDGKVKNVNNLYTIYIGLEGKINDDDMVKMIDKTQENIVINN